MKYDRLYSDDDGKTHFDEVEVALESTDFAPPAPAFYASAAVAAERYLFARIPVGWEGPIHPTPKRQLWIGTSGQSDITAGSGETRRYGPGDVLQLDDERSHGHVTRVVGDEAFCGVFVQLD